MTRVNHRNRFEKAHISGWTVSVRTDFGKSSIHRLLPPGEQFDGVRGPFNEVNASEYARVFRCSVGFRGSRRNFYLKQFLFRSTWDFVKHLFRPSRAKRALAGSLLLNEYGFCAPDIIALGERRCGPVCTSNFFITSELDNAKNLYDFFDGNWRGQSPQVLRDKRRFIRALGKTVGRMHRAGIFHGDLRAGNVLVRNTEAGWQFCFLDNERTRKFAFLPGRLRLKNLVQINMLQSKVISNTDRMRFFTSYLAQNERIRGRWKDLARKVVVKTSRRLQHSPPADPVATQRGE
jgi:serine/threonine protein kinase